MSRYRAILLGILAVALWAGLPFPGVGDEADDRRAEVFRKRPLTEKLASPRQTVQTLCFAVDAYNRIPALIADAVACLEFDAAEGMEQGAAELLAIQLEEILDELSMPFNTLLGGGDGKPVIFYDEQPLRIVLVKGKDGGWRFDRATVRRIPAMHRVTSTRTANRRRLAAQFREGMEDPTATMTSFLEHAIAGDYESAALRLDLSAIPVEERRWRGPYLAWKLACVMQRRSYLYSQTIPVDAEGPLYTWSADGAGRIAVERVRQPGGKDTWLFTAATVAAIDTMWRADRDKLPDVRYAVLRSIVPPPPDQAPNATARTPGGVKPDSVPDAFASPRRMLHAFFRAVEDAEFDDARQKDAYAFLDVSQFSHEDVSFIAPKRVAMLEAVLRKLKPDVSAVSDQWSAPPQALNGPGGLRVEIVRQADGCWRFSGETVARLPAMYESLPERDKVESERTHGLSNPRELLVTFFTAINRREDALAARCLNLSELPASARDDLGPVLAFKLKYVIDRIGRIYLQEIPNDPNGPQLVLYRGPLGRVALARRDDDTESKTWGFTEATVRQIEEMFERVLNLPADAQVTASHHIRLAPEFLHEPGIWLRLRLPPWLRRSHVGLEDYQWLGMVAAVALAWAVSVLARWIAQLLIYWFFHMGSAAAEQQVIRHDLRAFQVLVFVLAMYRLFEWIDLPTSVATHFYVLEKLLMTVLVAWTGFQWANLIRHFYERSEHMKQHRGLGDLVMPFTSTAIKVAVVLAALTYLVYQFGKGESLTRFLTGVGIIGLAVSLAAQDSLKNLFGTLLLITDRSFRIGDRLLIGDKEGVVEQVGFRSTKLRTPEDSLLVLPNALLANGVIDNMGLRNYRRIRILFTVALGTSLERMDALREGITAYLTSHAGRDSDRMHVHYQRIADGGIEMEVAAYLEARTSEAEKQAREALICEVLRLARTLEVEITLPDRQGSRQK